MAYFTAELPETYASITRPVALEIMKQLMENLNIKNDVPIFFPGANGRMTTWGSNNIEEKDTAQFTAREKIIMNIREAYTEEDLLNLVPKQTQHPPVFWDQQSQVKISPVYSRTKVVISLTYRTRDRWQAESFRDNWRRKIGENREYLTFQAKYQFPIPEIIEKVLYLLYYTRKKNLKDFDTYQDYLFHFGSVYLTSLTNSAGKGDTLAMSEIQENIFGNFSDPNPPEIEKDDIGSVWTSQLEFEYYYDKPISVNIKYPIMINNELVPESLYPKQLFDFDRLRTIKSMTNSLYYQIQNDMGYQWHMRGAVIRLPEFDDWSNDIRFKDRTKLLSVLLSIGTDNPKELFNLKEMGDYRVHETLQGAFARHSLYLTIRDEFPFYIQLYSGVDHLGDEYLNVDEELNVTSVHDLSLFENHHILISVVNNINDLTTSGKKRFLSEPVIVNAWLDIMIGTPPINGYPKVKGGNVDVEDFERVCRENGLTGRRNDYILNPGGLMATVGIFGVMTQHMKERP